jgi:dienelactone hydrolase
MLSGQSGTEQYRQVAGIVSGFGYDVVLLDAKAMMGTHGQALRDVIAVAQQGPHALPGNVGFVGFSLGGGLAVEYGPGWDDQVAVVVAWYPATGFVTDPPTWSANLRAPVVVFAGEADTFNDCCTLEKQRALADLAHAHNASYELTTYAGVRHGFVIGGTGYDPRASADALSRTRAALARYLLN